MKNSPAVYALSLFDFLFFFRLFFFLLRSQCQLLQMLATAKNVRVSAAVCQISPTTSDKESECLGEVVQRHGCTSNPRVWLFLLQRRRLVAPSAHISRGFLNIERQNSSVGKNKHLESVCLFPKMMFGVVFFWSWKRKKDVLCFSGVFLLDV